MKKVRIMICMSVFLCTALFCLSLPAADALRYSASAQVFDSFGQSWIDEFTRETGIRVDSFVTSSGSATNRLFNDVADISSSTREMYHRHKEYGYYEFAFCKDPLALIINAECNVDNLTLAQIRGIFSGEILNWKELGGPDNAVVVIVPGKSTAAYKNFHRMVMKRDEIKYDFQSYKSTMIIKAVQRVPWTISFIAQGALKNAENVKVLKVDGVSPRDIDYPYFQTFYYNTKGEPSGSVKKFIDYTRSEKGAAFMKAAGIIPLK